ncbi:MAG: TonB-dependent receptor [Candidatus Eremiobacteraeota bacterium]|nr:TonB-dependent receptor [Candidatus Eremiobacteraeota bacterium]
MSCRLWPVRAFFVVAFTVVAPYISTPDALAENAGVIRGIATDQKTHAPIPSVRVTARSPSATYSAMTDARGVYAFLSVIPDTYTLSFERSGYGPVSIPGITVLPGSNQTQNVALTTELRTIASVQSSRSAGSAFQPGMTADTYTVTSRQITMVQGKDFNPDQNSLLRSIPSVTIDKSGTVAIRGGFAFEAAYEFEGIDYTTPNANLQNTLQNIANFSMLNGVGSVELVPGGGDATHGNSGTGLVLLTAKHGTFPAYARVDAETYVYPFRHQLGIESSWADPKQRISNYASFLGIRQDYQYGYRGTDAATLGPRGTNAATLGSAVDPNLVFYSPQFLSSNDFVDNLMWRFGRDQRERLQFFIQTQDIHQLLDYGGFSNLQYISGGTAAGSQVGTCAQYPPPPVDINENSVLQNLACNIIPLYPGQPAPYSYVTQPDQLYSPFLAYKFEYADSLSSNALITARFFRAFSTQQQELPSQGVEASPYGGTRTGAGIDFVTSLGTKHLIKSGVIYAFSRPFGDVFNATSYTAFTASPEFVMYPLTHNGQQAPLGTVPPNFNPATPQAGSVEMDFFTPAQCALIVQPVPSCGYLYSYFPNGVRMPLEHDVPTAAQQTYGAYVQDDVTFSDRWKSELGLRLDGYNFQIPQDPSNPPGIEATAHQRLYEPHASLTYTFGRHDLVRFGYGRTLAIPLPSQLGANVDRDVYASFVKVPSYDASTGGPAMYCGISANQLCTNYADQLYWLTRDYRFGAQSLSQPLHGATFTNYDLSWAHEFPDGSSLKITPFYRRGYDVIDQTASVIGFNPQTGASIVGNLVYSNLGQQEATGVELLYTRDRPLGFSYQIGATYINQFGNEPPGEYLLPAALAAGQLYRSPDISPFQLNVAVQYKNRYGLRINPVLAYNVGYPYGNGYYTAVYCGGKAVIVPSTDLTTPFPSTGNYVDPENPGTCTQPNIAATRGNVDPAVAGGLLSRAYFNLDLVTEYTPPKHTNITFGVAIHNLTNYVDNVPQFNTCYGAPVATGIHNTTLPCTYSAPAYANPGSNFNTNPYVVYPNGVPLTINLYVQVRV